MDAEEQTKCAKADSGERCGMLEGCCNLPVNVV